MKRVLRKFFFGAAFVLGTGVNGWAAPITVNSGETVIFNFDLPGNDVYAGVVFQPNFTGSTLSDPEVDTLVVELFSNLDATGTRFFGPANYSDTTSVISSLSTSAAGTLDGLFSFRLTVTAGSVQLNPSAYGFFPDRSQTSPAFATVASAPEPASMLLLGTGLLGAGVRRWSQKRSQRAA